MFNIATLQSPAVSQPDAKPPMAARQTGPVSHAIKRQQIHTDFVTRAADAAHSTALLIATGRGASLSGEVLEMQLAFVKQLHGMRHQWLQGLKAWTQECTELKAANTLSKVVEQEFNLIGQFGQLLSNQATDLVNLMESAQVGYGFWVKEKLQQS